VSYSSENNEIRSFLKSFNANPQIAMDRLPQEIVDGHAVERGVIDYSVAKPAQMKLLSEPLKNDQASNIIEQGKVNANIKSLDQLKLTSSELKIIPWADSYWPAMKGLIGIRYSDPSFPNSKRFEDNFNYITSRPASSIVASANPIAIDQLSPAEKYDLLVGDSNWTLTQFSWARGKNYLNRGYNVPSWVGICHGWAGAAHMTVAVSHKPIIVSSVNHISITFYPSDIKALQSMLWAFASPPARFVGTKCSISRPAKNAIGRIIEPSCINNNPATFHLVLTNQLGLNQRSFVMDATYDAEIWNFPMLKYSYRYFNPQTFEPQTNVDQAIVPIAKFVNDKFKEFRSADARYIVGIVMDDTYIIEINPNHGPQKVSPRKTIRHFYDLELNAKYEIIGGEWYANAHPDFIWTFNVNAIAKSISDDRVNPADWGINDSVPNLWTSFAQAASLRGQPMLGVINSLLAREAP
jgi:hypothetical protein